MKLHSMIKKITLLSFFLLIIKITQAQYSWAIGEGFVGIDVATAVTLDNQGNVFLCGNVGDFAKFNGVQYKGRGLSDAFVSKYNSNGQLQWARLAGSDNNDKATAITTDAQGNVYVVGFFRDTAFFESTVVIAKGLQDIFIAKYDANGNFKWVNSAGGVGEDQAQSITIDASGKIYVSGFFTQNANFNGQNIVSSNPFAETFIAKYDDAGNLIWVKKSASQHLTSGNGITFSKQNKILLTGYYSGAISFGADTVFSSSPDYEIFLAQFDLDGTIQWLKSAGGAYEDVANAVACDPSGNAFITGYYAGSSKFDSYTLSNKNYNDVFIAKYDVNGVCQWAKGAGGISLDFGNAITTDNNGNVFFCGQYTNSFQIENETLTGPDRNIFFASYDGSGNLRWAKDAGESGADCALGIAVSSDNKVYVTGFYLYRCLFGNILLPLPEAEDLFLAKYDPSALVISDLGAEKYFEISSNPVQEKLSLNFLQAINGSSISIKNTIGAELFSTEVKSENEIIDVGFLPAGVYFTTFQKGNLIATRKFVKQ
jgi:hypothetical protein